MSNSAPLPSPPEIEPEPNRAMRAAHVVAQRGTVEFVKPGQLIEVRFVKGQSLSLASSRLLALMILAAGGDAWQPIRHRIRKSDIRRGHKGNERIGDMLEELHRTLFAQDDKSWRDRKAKVRFSLIQYSAEEVEGGDSGWIEWEFTPDARRLIQDSETYAVLNRQAVLGFRSVYALRLYELGALRLHRREAAWRGDVTALRAALGIPAEAYAQNFSQIRGKVLIPAKAEIDQLAHFTLDWREVRKGNKIVELEITFTPKDAPAQIETVDELSRGKYGRKARREGTVEAIVEPAATKSTKAALGFPGGSLSFYDGGDPEYVLTRTARDYGGGWDIDLIADAYRAMLGEKLEKLTGDSLIASWGGFCRSYTARRGAP
jgi:hypothetical protein